MVKNKKEKERLEEESFYWGLLWGFFTGAIITMIIFMFVLFFR